jgi:hypothetical protein
MHYFFPAVSWLQFFLKKTGNPEELGSGNSIRIFQNPDGQTDAVVFRLEFPAASLFGIPPGGGSPKIHSQMVKGSEVERRQSTILRRRRATL